MGHEVSKDTISRWIKETLRLAGIDTDVYKAHSTRSASISESFALKVNLEHVGLLSRARWTNASTFARFYHKPLDGEMVYQDALLSC